MFNFKKVSAIATSALLTSMSFGVVAAANFPDSFISELPAIVYGASADSMDSTQANSISSYLADKVPSTGGDVTGGDSVKLEKSSTKFQLSYGINDVIGTAITDSSPGNGLPNLLADGKYIDSANDEFDYKQKVNLPNWSVTMFDDNDYKDDSPTVGVKIANAAEVLNYTLDFTDKPCWEDLATTDLPILGKEYYVLSVTTNTTLNLLDASSGTTTISEGETTTINVAGKNYDVGINFIGSSSVKLEINGQVTNTLSAAQTQRLNDGAYVGVKEINTQDYAGGIKTVEFAIGKGKLKVVGGQDIEINDESVTGMKAYIDNTAAGSSCTSTGQLDVVHLRWAADGDVFIAPDSSPIMPGFEALKLTTTGMYYPAEEVIRVKASGADSLALEDFPLRDSVEDIDILYVTAGNRTVFSWGNISDTGIGKDKDNQLETSTTTTLLFNSTDDEYFVASWSDGNDAESYLMRATGYGISNGVPYADIQYKSNGVWTTAEEDAQVADTVTIGNLELTVNGLNNTIQYVNFTAGTNVNFSTLYSKEGMKVYLPWTLIGNNSGNLTGSLMRINDTHLRKGMDQFNLSFAEEDKNENIDKGGNITVVIGFNTQSTPEVHVSNLIYSAVGGDDSGSSSEIGSTDVFRNFLYSELASEVLWDKSGDQDFVDITYHGEESYAEIYLLDSSAMVGSVGNMVFKDSEKSDWQNKNVIIVGGTCINTAAAEALGVSSGTCAADFEAATSVGSGKFLIQSVADKFSSGKLALVVAGYEKSDTAAAASRLINQPSTIDTTAGNKYIGVVGVQGASTVSKVA